MGTPMGFGDSANGGLFSSAWRATRARATGEEGSGAVGCKRESCRQYACAAHSGKRISVSLLLHRSWPPVHLPAAPAGRLVVREPNGRGCTRLVGVFVVYLNSQGSTGVHA